MGEQEPQMIIDDRAGPEQRAALEDLACVLSEFTEQETSIALDLADKYESPEKIIPLVAKDNQQKLTALFESWSQAKKQEAFGLAEFDEATETAIQADEQFVSSKEKRDKLTRQRNRPEKQLKEAYAELWRIRFAKFGGRIVLYGAANDEPTNRPTQSSSELENAS